MSEPQADNTSDESEDLMHVKTTNMNPKVTVIPKDFSSVHVDKILVAIDWDTGTIGLTLLNMHCVPKIEMTGGWGMEGVGWEVVGEIKIATAALNVAVVYYLNQVGGGFDVLKALKEHQRKNPNPSSPRHGTSYGPTDFGDAPPNAQRG